MIDMNTFIMLPDVCPACGHELEFDGIHLMCENERCSGRLEKILASSLHVIGMKGIGPKGVAPFAVDFDNILEVIIWVREFGKTDAIERYGLRLGTRSHEVFINAFSSIKSLPYYKVIHAMGYAGVGKKISMQVANEMCGADFDYARLERALVEKMRAPEMKKTIQEYVSELERVRVKVDRPVKPGTDVLYVCLTGSPSSAGYKTKTEFLEHYAGRLIETSLSDVKCNYLVTNDLNSTTGKMADAKKKGIAIVTYGHGFFGEGGDRPEKGSHELF